jgi:hypothetical protein
MEVGAGFLLSFPLEQTSNSFLPGDGGDESKRERQAARRPRFPSPTAHPCVPTLSFSFPLPSPTNCQNRQLRMRNLFFFSFLYHLKITCSMLFSLSPF